MKISALAATIASLASVTAAFDVAVTFKGARGERFGQTFPTDASSHAISMYSIPVYIHMVWTKRITV